MRRPQHAGFTLVEVIVVLAVVLLLSGIAVPLISGYVDDSKRARAASEVKLLAGALASFYKDVGIYPTRDAAGRNNRLLCLITGLDQPPQTRLTRGHAFQSWASNSTRGDLLDNHLLRNQPGGTPGAAYPITGSDKWRGPYLAGPAPLDPWGRPYYINVMGSYNANATNYFRVYVLSAGPDGDLDTRHLATINDDVHPDDIGVVLHQRR